MPPSSIALVLRRRFDEIRSQNPAYSMRAYARKLDVHPAALSEILHGKRTVSGKLASRLVKSPVLRDAEREQILESATAGSLMRKIQRTKIPQASRLDLDHYFLVSEWQYYAILSLTETKGFKAEPPWIARRLGLTEEGAAAALERLVRLGFFSLDKKGKLVPKKNVRLCTTDDIASASLKQRHISNAEAARLAVEKVPVELREFTFMTLAVNPSKLKEAKVLMREFREKLSLFLEEGEKSEVYEFCLSLFPRTVSKEKP